MSPVDYGQKAIRKEWLLDVCLEQHKIIKEIDLGKISFEDALREYMQFLYMCYKNFGTVIVPTASAHFLWHAHMQDNKLYRSDTKTILGRYLDHHDSKDQGKNKSNEY